MSNFISCKNCKYFRKLRLNELAVAGYCYRFPPKSKHRLTIKETEWCGEFKYKEDKR